jgi:Zn-dependent peptidase ImmA (M78 family)
LASKNTKGKIMAVRRRKIRELVETLLRDARVTEAPVPVWEIARAKGARIAVDSLEGDLSGFLFRDPNQKVIGVNTHHASVRQNFTVAHELGHLLLHDQDQLHVDRAFPTVRLRDDTSSQGVDDAEKEANLFAAELLMPHEFLRRDVAAQNTLDLYDDSFVPALASRYGVSVQALMFRLQYLGYIEE